MDSSMGTENKTLSQSSSGNGHSPYRGDACEVRVKVASPLPPESQAEFASDDVSVPYLAPRRGGPKARPSVV